MISSAWLQMLFMAPTHASWSCAFRHSLRFSFSASCVMSRSSLLRAWVSCLRCKCAACSWELNYHTVLGSIPWYNSSASCPRYWWCGFLPPGWLDMADNNRHAVYTKDHCCYHRCIFHMANLHVSFIYSSNKRLWGESTSGGCVAIVGIMTRMAKKVDMNRKFVVFPWLQKGYRISKDAMNSLKYMGYVDKKHTISAYYHEKLRSGARKGVITCFAIIWIFARLRRIFAFLFLRLLIICL